jgi:hypothetical protein
MNNPTSNPQDPLAGASREEMLSALFANMVIQQANMAMMLLGKVAHPETGQFMHDMEAAKMFIDQLEMIEAKTKGNLSKQEEALMKQALGALRMAFVEAVDAPAGTGAAEPGKISEEAHAPIASAPSASPSPAPAAEPKAAPAPTAAPDASTAPDESRKKFSKKY